METNKSIRIIREMEVIPQKQLSDIVGGKKSVKPACFINLCHSKCNKNSDTAMTKKPLAIFPIKKKVQVN